MCLRMCTGSGFSSVAGQNVVLIRVPVSSTFLNGIVLCDVTSASGSQLTCVPGGKGSVH